MLNEIHQLGDKKNPLDRLAGYARFLVRAQEMCMFEEQMLSVLGLRYSVREILNNKQSGALLELLRTPKLAHEVEAFRELLGAVELELMIRKDRNTFKDLQLGMEGLQADLCQKQGADKEGDPSLKNFLQKTDGQCVFQRLLNWAHQKKRSLDATICEEALLSAAELAQQQSNPRTKIHLLLQSAQTAQVCEQLKLAVEFGSQALRICREQKAGNSSLEPLQTQRGPVARVQVQLSLENSFGLSKKLPQHLPEDLTELELLITRFLADVNSKLNC